MAVVVVVAKAGVVPDSGVLTVPTERPGLVLRELTVEHLDAYFGLVDRNRDHLNQRGDYPFEHTATAEDLRQYFTEPWDNNIRLGVWLEGDLIGRVDLVPVNPPRWTVGYWLDQAKTGRGAATVACRAAIDHARTRGATEIYAGITHGNDPSVGVVRRLGFEHIQDVDNRSRWRLALVADPPPPVMA